MRLFNSANGYHIFNQKNASAIFLGQINWGHFTSSNLLYWTEEKPALTPDNAYDKNGIWSGHAVINDDVKAVNDSIINKKMVESLGRINTHRIDNVVNKMFR
jgi:sucrose-6-phosphate hydrolase SacC (GH32 family)